MPGKENDTSRIITRLKFIELLGDIGGWTAVGGFLAIVGEKIDSSYQAGHRQATLDEAYPNPGKNDINSVDKKAAIRLSRTPLPREIVDETIGKAGVFTTIAGCVVALGSLAAGVTDGAYNYNKLLCEENAKPEENNKEK